MMLKVGNEFLDFNDLIEMEKKIKLIEEIDATDGDFSYSFDLAKTQHNTTVLGNPMPDNISKPVYQRIEAILLNDSGAELYKGFIRLERVTSVYECSFFAGNNNWFSRITGQMSDLALDRFDMSQTESSILATRGNRSGITFPLLDNGPLLTRGSIDLKIEDMVPGIYVKTLFNQVFAEAGIKVEGELLREWIFNNAVCVKNSKNKSEIDARTSFVQKSVQQNIAGVPISAVTELITWDNDSVYPYFDGSSNNFDLGTGRYTADMKMVVNVSAIFSLDVITAAGSVNALLYKNGVQYASMGVGDLGTATTFGGKAVRVPLEAGDYLEVYVKMIIVGGSDIEITGTLKVTPTYIYKVYGESIVPNWTQQDFISNVLRLFNCLCSFNATNNTLTINLFEKIKDKPSIDLSEYISEIETDYADFVSEYGRQSILKYNEVSFDELKEYNFGKFLRYGQGVIEVNNDFIQDTAEIVQSDFSNPVAYVNSVFGMSMERLNLIELEEGDNFEFTGVSDSSGVARFAIPEDVYVAGDLVRITEAINPVYNGDWVVGSVGSGWVEFRGLDYDTDSTGTVTKLEYNYSNDDDVFLVVNIPEYSIPNFSDKPSFRFEGSAITNFSLGYFDIINTGRQVNIDYKHSLSFGGFDDTLRYQMTLTEKYFRVFGQILNDPVKLNATATLPQHIYYNIDFLHPVTIRTIDTTNRYYLNRMTGYKESYYPCILELIKLP